MGVSLLLQCETRQAVGGGAIDRRVFVTTVYDATCNEGSGPLMGVSFLSQCTTLQASRGRGY